MTRQIFRISLPTPATRVPATITSIFLPCSETMNHRFYTAGPRRIVRTQHILCVTADHRPVHQGSWLYSNGKGRLLTYIYIYTGMSHGPKQRHRLLQRRRSAASTLRLNGDTRELRVSFMHIAAARPPAVTTFIPRQFSKTPS